MLISLVLIDRGGVAILTYAIDLQRTYLEISRRQSTMSYSISKNEFLINISQDVIFNVESDWTTSPEEW